MKTLCAVASVSTLIGCSSVGAHSNARTASDEAARAAELTALRVQYEEQEQELRTVRGQLALARAEVQELKGDRSHSSERSKRSASDVGLPWATDGEGGLAMEPVLRIDGEIVDERLPTTADIPEMPDFVESVPAATTPREEVNFDGYRRALSLIREQRFNEALEALDAYVATKKAAEPDSFM